MPTHPVAMIGGRSTTWQPMASAPRDGTLVLVKVRATEQGPGEPDMVRWARSARSDEESWVATDSDPFARIAYADNELVGWKPLPALGSVKTGEAEPQALDEDETDGSAI